MTGLLNKLYTATTGKQLGETNYYQGQDGLWRPKRTSMKLNPDESYRAGDFLYKGKTRVISPLPLRQVSPEFDLLTGIRGFFNSKPSYQSTNLGLKNKIINNSKVYRKVITKQYAKGKNIPDDTLDKVYIAAYKKSNTDIVKLLRDTHFIRKASFPLTNSDGTPTQLYHTVGDKFNPNFNIFDTNIEGVPTAIYTTDGLPMSLSYSRHTNRTLSDAKYAIKRRRRYYDDFASEITRIRNAAYKLHHPKAKTQEEARQLLIQERLPIVEKGRYSQSQHSDFQPQYVKQLYSNSSGYRNPDRVLNALGRNWNSLPITQDFDLRKLIHTDFNGYLTTRDYEKALMRINGSDRIIIKNVRDYGPGHLVPMDKSYTVVENLNPYDLKYSNPVTYDNNGIIIPLSKRDNFQNPDLRY